MCRMRGRIAVLATREDGESEEESAVSGLMTSATPASAAAPSAPPVAGGATAGVGTAQPEVARRSRWRTVGLVALGLLIVLR